MWTLIYLFIVTEHNNNEAVMLLNRCQSPCVTSSSVTRNKVTPIIVEIIAMYSSGILKIMYPSRLQKMFGSVDIGHLHIIRYIMRNVMSVPTITDGPSMEFEF